MYKLGSNFEEVLKERLEALKATAEVKGKEYTTGDGDRYHTFRVGARLKGETPEQTLYGIAMKQVVSVVDMIAYTAECPERLSIPLINEKLGDLNLYTILLEGLLKERVLMREEEKRATAKIAINVLEKRDETLKRRG